MATIDPTGFQTALRNRLTDIDQIGQSATSNLQSLMAARQAAQAQQEADQFRNVQRDLYSHNANTDGYNGGSNYTSGSYHGTGKDTFDNFMGAIRNRESSGRYGVMGVPVHGDRALGAYQIMGNNLPEWSEQAIGRRVSAQEFLHNPKLQDQIAGHFLQRYYNEFGPAGAAVAWYAGEGTARKWIRQHGRGFDAPQHASGVKFSSISAYAYGILHSMGLA